MSRPPYPQAEKQVVATQIATYMDIMFSGVAGLDNGGYINLRGIGEKGTAQEGKFREDVFCPNTDNTEVAGFAWRQAQRWGQWHVATFVVPAIMRKESGKADDVELMTCMLLDMDTDCDTQEAWEWMKTHVGEPTMVVKSGGTNGAGSPKRHFYWRLANGYEQIERIVTLRHILAMRAGGDLQFGVGEYGRALGRAHQPIRVPGSIHSKHGKHTLVELEQYDDEVIYTLDDIELAIKAMPTAPWLGAAERERAERHRSGESIQSLFSERSGAGGGGGAALLDQTIESGGASGTSRFDAFSKVAGHFLRRCRDGAISDTEGFEQLEAWCLAKMEPCWPIEKIRKEWTALKNVEVRHHGPLVKRAAAVSLFSPQSAPDSVLDFVPHDVPVEDTDAPDAEEIEVEMVEGEVVETAPENPLLAWAAHRWVQPQAIEMPFLVDGLICEGEQHMMAGEGGCGKSFSMIDLAIRVAAKGNHPELEFEWLGQQILKGGTVVLMLNEDSVKTVHNRLLTLGGTGGELLKLAGDKLIPLPMSSLGGAFTLSDKEGAMSSRWAEYFAALKGIDDLSLMVMDTFSTMLHGSEVDPTIVNQMMTQANTLTGTTGCAMLWLHHVRKPSEDGIRNAEDMRNAVRGSTAIIGAMRNVFGMWRCTDYSRRCKAFGINEDKDAIWRCAVLKTNLDVPLMGEKTLVRWEGRLLDYTEHDMYNGGHHALRAAWLVLAAKEAAKAGYPFSNGAKNAQDGFYQRRHQLPEEMKTLGHVEIKKSLEYATANGLLVCCAAKGSTTAKWLDVPNGDYATSSSGADMAKGAWTPPDWTQWVYDAGQEICVKGGGSAATFAAMLKQRAEGGNDE